MVDNDEPQFQRMRRGEGKGERGREKEREEERKRDREGGRQTDRENKLKTRMSMLSSEFHSFLFLPLITKPHSNHVFLQIEFLGNGGDFLA